MEANNFFTGKVIFYDSQKGFGFIQNETDEQFFFHVTGVTTYPVDTGDQVNYQIGVFKNRPLAINVTKL